MPPRSPPDAQVDTHHRELPVILRHYLMGCAALERGNRYDRHHLEQDLWGHWTLTRVVGRTGARRGRYMTSWVASLEDGLATLGTVAKRRRERGFRLVTAQLEDLARSQL